MSWSSTNHKFSGYIFYSEEFTEDILSIWNYEMSVDQYNVYGGTGKESVTAQIENLQFWLQQ